MNNKGAVIALYLTVVVAIVLSAVALFNFLNHGDVFGERTQNNENVISHSIAMREYIEGTAKIILSESIDKGISRETVMESADRHDLHIVGQGNFFDKIANGDFELTQIDGKVRLEVSQVLIYSQSGSSSIKHVFDFTIEANDKGNEIRFINN